MSIIAYLKRIFTKERSASSYPRQHERKVQTISIPMPGLILLDAHGRSRSGEMTNFSKSGLSLSLDEYLESGSIIHLRTLTVELKLKIAWCDSAALPSGRFRCGCYCVANDFDLEALLQGIWSVDGS